jgi:hypothetical protein
MPPLSDHTRRDAEHASRAAIGVEVARFRRRMEEHAKGNVKEKIERATQNGEAIDGTELGKAAAVDAIAAYVSPGEPTPAIDAPAAQSD